jgi:hypothetical protein
MSQKDKEMEKMTKKFAKCFPQRYQVDEGEWGEFSNYMEDLSQEMKSPEFRHINPMTREPFFPVDPLTVG